MAEIKFKKEFGEDWSYDAKLTVGLVVVLLIFGLLSIAYNYRESRLLDERIAELETEADNVLNGAYDFHEYTFEGKDSMRIEKDNRYLRKMFSEVFTFSGTDEYLECRKRALNDYSWNQIFVDSFFGDENNGYLYDMETGEKRSDINLHYDDNSTKIFLISTEGDESMPDRYYHYLCFVTLYVGNSVKGEAGYVDVVAEVMLNPNQTGSIECKVAKR